MKEGEYSKIATIVHIRKLIDIIITKNILGRIGASYSQIMGQIWSNTYFCMACKIRMLLTAYVIPGE